jgi:hypothetical protein
VPTDPNSGGWKLQTYGPGGFSVSMPGKPNEMSPPNEAAIKGGLIAIDFDRKQAFSVMYDAVPSELQSKTAAEQATYIVDFVKKTNAGAKITESKSTLSQLPALQVEAVTDKSDANLVGRCCVVGGRIYMLLTSGENITPQSQDVQRFFNSFRVTNGGKADMVAGGGPQPPPGGGGPQPPPGGVGEIQPPAGGGTAFAPTGGQFSVEFPAGSVKQSSQKLQGPAGTTTLGSFVLETNGGRNAYFVMYTDMPGKVADTDQALEGGVNGMKTKGTVKSVQKISLGAYPGREAILDLNDAGFRGTGKFRLYLAGNRLFVVAVAGPDDQFLNSPQAEQFFNSFKITK